MSTLSDSSQDNLGWVYPLPPQTVVTAVEAFVGVVSGVAVLIEDQDYVDVTFGTEQPNEDWVLLETVILNTVDADPLNIFGGIITEKTVNGFRMQLNGLPDSENYFLSWSIRGVFGYYMNGPTSGNISVPSSEFTVRLPDESTLSGTVVITPSDGDAAGTFTPDTVELTLEEPTATFTYTPSSYGARAINVTNDRGLIDPPQIAYSVMARIYTLSGPSSGGIGVASTDFTVALPVGGLVSGTVVVTPSDDGDGGTFEPTTVALTTVAPSDTFTYTPITSGDKTISVTNDSGLTNPVDLTYAVAGLADGSPISTWPDSSGNGHTATQTGSARPTFKVNIVNSLPVVRFTLANSTLLNLASPVSGAQPWTSFAVLSPFSPATAMGSIAGPAAAAPIGVVINSDGNTYVMDRDYYNLVAAYYSGFHVYATYTSGASPTLYKDGAAIGMSGPFANANSNNFVQIGGALSSGDLAEIIMYNVVLSGTDRANIEKYLGTKYGISVAGGSAVQPDTVTGLVAWWKADALI